MTRRKRLPPDVARLRRTLVVGALEANLLGQVVVAAFFLLFQAEKLPLVTRRALLIFTIVMVVALLVGLRIVYMIILRPLLRWLAESDGSEPAPERYRIGVVLQPIGTAILAFSGWALGGLGFGLVTAFVATAQSPRRFVAAFGGTLVAGLISSGITYLRMEDIWRPWLPRFFAGTDPTDLPIPRMRLRGRLNVTYTLATALPLLTVALVVSVRAQVGVSATSLEFLVWFLVVAGLVGGAVMARNVRSSITHPVERLQRAMDTVREGELDVEVPVDRTDELGELASGFNEMVEGLQFRDELKDLLDRQVGGAVADRVIAEGVHLGGGVREVTALFIDLASFTRLAEERPPEEVAELLNTVFSVVVHAVDRHDGLVNKFQGDAALAVFGAPSDDPQHAVHALRAAEGIAARLEPMDVDFGIGMSTGEVFAGNVGSESRFEYTVIGNPVNEAARLQELTRDLGRRVLLSGRTAEAVRDLGGRQRAFLVPLEPVVLRGKTEETELFSLSPQAWRGGAADLDGADLAAVVDEEPETA